MEIAFFFVGTTRTASDQSISLNSCQSGSLAIAASISSSVIASTRAQSVFPFRRSPHFRVTIRSFFIFPRATCGDYSDDFGPPGKDHCDQAMFQRTHCAPALLVVAV